MNLEPMEHEFDLSQVQRPFRFGEFFAGFAGFTRTLEELGGTLVETTNPQDHYEGWDILTDEGLEQGLSVCETLDHGHFAPPCKTFTKARRSDKFGVVKVLRSEAYPEGWGEPEAEEANRIVARMVQMILVLVRRGRTFAIENPWHSFLWSLRAMAVLFKMAGVELVLLHQCAYGAVTQKATGILTNAAWMKKVCACCHQVREHYHLKGGLVGLVWSYADQQMVWRTSLAAEYPCGLTVAWSKELLKWLHSPEGLQWMKSRSYVLVGKWQNTLVLAGAVAKKAKKASSQRSETLLERRERENNEAIGGLRNSKRAVARSTRLRNVGERLRLVVDRWISAELVQQLEQDLSAGITKEQVWQLRQSLAAEFKVDSEADGWPVALWEAILCEAADPEMRILPRWMREGFPLGIMTHIEHSNVFPQTHEDTAAVEASRLEGEVLQDYMEDIVNYKSFLDESSKAQELLDHMVEKDRAEVFTTWQEVVERFGQGARLTKAGCLVKTKEDGAVKARLIFDGRRSGVNGLIVCRERVNLPRISDVVTGMKQLLSNNQSAAESGQVYIEMFALDFKDAFNLLQLREDERGFVVMKGLNDEWGRPRYYVSKCIVFGVATGPLIWSRLAAAAMRVTQAALLSYETDVNCYIDDPLVMSVAASHQEHTRHLLVYVGLWTALGLEISWHKVVRGRSLNWIGFSLELCGPQGLDLLVADAKKAKLLDTLEELRSCRGVMPIRLLRYAVGVLGWLSSAVPAARPWLSMIWAAITGAREPVKESTRRRKGLIFVRQVDNALRWLHALLHLHHNWVGLYKVHKWRPCAATALVQTDASPFGIGGVLMVSGQTVSYFGEELQTTDFSLFGSERGDPAYQSEYELLAVLVALRVFARKISQIGALRVVLRGDNTSTLHAALTYKAGSPITTQLAAEIFLEVEHQGLVAIVPQHLPGTLNVIPDKLSRLHVEEVPWQLANVQRLKVPKRDMNFYRAWPNRS